MKILILGKGKVGLAVFHYLKKLKIAKKVAFFVREKDIKDFDILIGALPSKVGTKGLKLALKYRKDLIDISAVPIPFYLKHRKEILKKGIKVIPGCGVSPGLVNLIVGFESQNFEKIKEIEISAGTLPQNIKYFFPFTWCFEDLIEQHLEGVDIIKNGKKTTLSPFSGYRREKLAEIGEYESYFIEEWSTLFYSLKSSNINFQIRVIRPIGFFHFFQYLKNFGFLKKENLPFTKKILISTKTDNVTLALVRISGIYQNRKKKVLWKIFSFAKKRDKLNSMQKITALFAVIILKFLFNSKLRNGQLLFIEELGQSPKIFKEILKELKREGILIKKIYG